MTTFKAYWKSLYKPEKDALAYRAGTTYAHLSGLANGHFRLGKNLYGRLHKASGKITHAMLEPLTDESLKQKPRVKSD